MDNKFKVIIKDGRLNFYDLNKFQQLLKSKDGKKGYIIFEDDIPQTTSGNEKLYKWWLDIINTYLHSTPEEIDSSLRSRFINDRQIEDLSFKEFYYFLDKVESWAVIDMEFHKITLPRNDK